MSGNVAEMCFNDITGKVCSRGGDHTNECNDCTVNSKSDIRYLNRSYVDVGFRVVRNVDTY